MMIDVTDAEPELNFSWEEVFQRDLKVYKETRDVGEIWYNTLILV